MIKWIHKILRNNEVEELQQALNKANKTIKELRSIKKSSKLPDNITHKGLRTALEEKIEELSNLKEKYDKLENMWNKQKKIVTKYKKELIEASKGKELIKNGLLFEVSKQENSISRNITFSDHDGFEYYTVQSLLGRFLAGIKQKDGKVEDVFNEIGNMYQVVIQKYTFKNKEKPKKVEKKKKATVKSNVKTKKKAQPKTKKKGK